jgi:hypothetical protein
MLYPPHCGDSRMSHRCARRTLPDYLFMVSYYWNVGNKTVRYSIIYNVKVFQKRIVRTINLIPTFLLLSLGRYLRWWTNSSRVYYTPNSQCFNIRPIVSVSAPTLFSRYIYKHRYQIYSANDAFLKYFHPVRSKIFESQIIFKSLGERNQRIYTK